MKRKILCILIVCCLLLLSGCREPVPPRVNLSATGPETTAVEPTAGTTDMTTAATEPEDTKATEAATEPEETAASEATTAPTEPQATEPTQAPTEPTIPTEPSEPAATTPAPTDPIPSETVSPEPPTEETVPPTTEPEQTQPTETEPEPYVPTEDFKREVAYYAALYLNQYRAEKGVPACTILPGMTLVAEYRADQLCYNFDHTTADIREALAYYQYGRWVDATIVGLPASESYYEAGTNEAICAGFKGTDAESMGKYIANMIRESSNHWDYVGSAEYSYIAVGVEYREDSKYRCYGCVMVGTVDYG